jgi:hypothetical protein
VRVCIPINAHRPILTPPPRRRRCAIIKSVNKGFFLLSHDTLKFLDPETLSEHYWTAVLIVGSVGKLAKLTQPPWRKTTWTRRRKAT